MVVLIACSLICACSEDNNDIVTIPVKTEISTEDIVFCGDASNQQMQIQFKAGAAWTAMLTTSNDWIEITPTHGKAGESTIIITLTKENKSSFTRNAELLVLVDGTSAPYRIKISQESSPENDIKISGEIQNGVMILHTDKSGSNLIGTIKVESSQSWDILPVEDNNNWLKFSKKEETTEGNNKVTYLTVIASYDKFTSSTMSGSFLIGNAGAEPTEIKVEATAFCYIFQEEHAHDAEKERIEYEFKDTLISGKYQITFYVESNMKWELKEVPEWMEIASGIATNQKDNGELQTKRVGVGLLIKENALSTEAQEAVIAIRNNRGSILKEVLVKFAGLRSDYLEHDFNFPSYDPLGNDFSFEAKASYINPDNRDDWWKKVEIPFNIKTAANYESIEGAPYHLIMCESVNGIIARKEVHWATLRMGDSSNDQENKGIYTKEIYITANDRGDEDDQKGITSQTLMREAFIFIVPKGITFDNLFEGDSELLKAEYADKFSRISQKNDHNASYTLLIEGLQNGSSIEIPASGIVQPYKILQTSTLQLDYELKRLFFNNSLGEWTEQLPTSAQSNSILLEFKEISKNQYNLILNVGANTTGKERRFRFYISAYVGDGHENVDLFNFEIIQAAN